MNKTLCNTKTICESYTIKNSEVYLSAIFQILLANVKLIGKKCILSFKVTHKEINMFYFVFHRMLFKEYLLLF